LETVDARSRTRRGRRPKRVVDKVGGANLALPGRHGWVAFGRRAQVHGPFGAGHQDSAGVPAYAPEA
jgi:hypothetical protein